MADIKGEFTDVELSEKGVYEFTYEGERYRYYADNITINKIQEGDILRRESGGNDVTKGAFYEVIDRAIDYPFEDLAIVDDAGDTNPAAIIGTTAFRKVEGIAESSRIVERLPDVEERVETLEGKSKFKAGDKVVLTDGGGQFPLRGFVNGEEYVVSDAACNHGKIGKSVQITRETSRGDRCKGFAKESQLKLVEETPKVAYETVKRPAKAGERILITNAVTLRSSYKTGDVFEVVRKYSMFSGAIQVRGVDEHIDHMEYEVINEEEDEAPTPRKPDEFREGDIVYYENKRWFGNEGYGVIKRTSGHDYLISAKNIEGNDANYYLLSEEITLVAPVEARVDR